MRRKKEYPLLEGLEITEPAAEGKCLGLWEGKVVFVPMTVPGDIVDVQIRIMRRRYMEGYVVAYRHRSPLRVEPICSHFGICGGCKWQNLPYGEQLKFKQRQVEDQLRRIGRLELPEIQPIVPSEKTEYYRNKLEFTFAPHRWKTWEELREEDAGESAPALGFHIPDKFDKILDIGTCHLQADPSNAIRLFIKEWCLENEVSFYDIREHSGLMRNLIIRTSSTGEIMVILVTALNDRETVNRLSEALVGKFPEITSLQWVVNGKLNDSISDLEPITVHGRDHILEKMEDLTFKVGPKSFYQTNSEQALRLYSTAREFADAAKQDTVYDLYTGTGTIANFIARRCAKVVGIEYVPEAIEDARVNSSINGIGNTVFYAGDMKDVLSDTFIAENGQPDIVILDPPRAGVHPDVIETILRAAPRRIVYVSCNPATQARDIALMDRFYEVSAVRPVDMFPHTQHVENVCRLDRRPVPKPETEPVHVSVGDSDTEDPDYAQ